MGQLRPFDRRLHFTNPQTTGEYFGQDCGTHSKPQGQGKNSGIIYTNQGYYPHIIPRPERQTYRNDVDAPRARRGDRRMHRTTIDFNKSTQPEFLTTTKQEFSGRQRVVKSAMPHACRTMHTSQIVFGTDTDYKRSTTYVGEFPNRHHQKHHEILAPIIDNKVQSIESSRVKTCLNPGHDTVSLSEYGSTHKKLGLALDLSHPKYPIPKPHTAPRHYNVLTGEDLGPSWTERNHKISGNRVLSTAVENEKCGFLF